MKVNPKDYASPIERLPDDRLTQPLRSSQDTAHADKVSLSPAAQEKLANSADKVQALREAIAQGKYSVDLDRLAQAIVEKERFDG